MMKLDPEDSDAEDEEGKSSLQNTPSKQSAAAAAAPLPQIDFESSIDNLSGAGGGGGGGAPVGRRRRHSRMTTLSSKWSSRPLSMRRSRTTTTLSRTPRVQASQVRGTSTCEVPRVSHDDPYFVTGSRCFFILCVQIHNIN